MFPDLTVFWVIFFILLTGVALNGLIVRPVLGVMQARETAAKSARELAESAARKAQAAAAEFDAQMQAARGEAYRDMDTTRRRALERRTELLALTRTEAEASIRDATEQLRSQTESARRGLEQESVALAGEIVERVLGRKVS